MLGHVAANAPTTTKWVEGKKLDENGKEFVLCRLVARDFKPKTEGIRDDLFAAMPPLESKKMLFALVAGNRTRRANRGHLGWQCYCLFPGESGPSRKGVRTMEC